jgi:hypothetical protein
MPNFAYRIQEVDAVVECETELLVRLRLAVLLAPRHGALPGQARTGGLTLGFVSTVVRPGHLLIAVRHPPLPLASGHRRSGHRRFT